VKHRPLAVALVAIACLLAAGVSEAGLKDYVRRSDDTYAFRIDSTVPFGSGTVFFVDMTSQTWQGIPWRHWLSIFRPAEVAHPDKALLLIGGGNNNADRPDTQSDEARVLAMIAQQQKVVVAVLEQVPNQPLFDGMYEDAIISFTFERFLRGEGDDWPLLLPMTKSAVRAMDTVQAVAKEHFGQAIRSFVVTGASKRGWTTWLTAAADPRVAAIAPMVIDVLNMGPQMAHQKRVYGAYSRQVHDYTERGIQDHMQTPDGQRLLNIVDPYAYRSQLTLPKLVILGTNDDYWTVDSAKFYFNDLRGPKFLHYEPNAGHGLSLNIVPVIMAFLNTAMTSQTFPKLNWRTLEDGTFEVTWDHPEGAATLWQAQSPNRDFRRAQWGSTPLAGPQKVQVNIAAPEQGWTAYYVQVTFPIMLEGRTMRYPLSTLMQVVPDAYPAY